MEALQQQIAMSSLTQIAETRLACAAILKNQLKMEENLREFTYNQAQSEVNNLHRLSTVLVKILRIEDRKLADSLREYLSTPNNIPIEVNLKGLKPEHIAQLVQNWLSSASTREPSLGIQKIYSNNHRNLMFKRVLFDEKATIDDYFATLSNKAMLKAVDLYQLLNEILSPYFLYEFVTDSEHFFEKVNSFESFLKMAARFEQSDQRIIGDHKAEDMNFIRRFEFEQIIDFWEKENPQLLLLPERRANSVQMGIQTEGSAVRDEEVQTDLLRLDSLINHMLGDLNKITLQISTPELESVHRIFGYLRQEKIELADLSRQDTLINQLNSPKRQESIINKSFQSDPTLIKINPIAKQNPDEDYFSEAEQSETLFRANFAAKSKQVGLQPNLDKYLLSKSVDRRRRELLMRVYNSYSTSGKMEIEQLQKCLCDLGVIQERDSALIFRLLKGRLVKNAASITSEQFLQIFCKIMSEDKDLTLEVVEEFSTIYCSKAAIPLQIWTQRTPISPKRKTLGKPPYQARSYYSYSRY